VVEQSAKTNWSAVIGAAATIIAAIISAYATTQVNKREISSLKSQIVTLENRPEAPGKGNQSSSASENATALPNTVNELNEAQRQKADLESRNDFLTKTVKALQEQAASTLDQLQKAKQENAYLESRNTSLTKTVEALQKRSVSLTPPALGAVHLPPKDSVRTVGRFTFGINNAELSSLALYKCKKDEGEIVCYFVVARVSDGNRDYDTGRRILYPSKLYDKFNHPHELVRDYFIDGEGNPQKLVNLAKDWTSWYVQEFSDSRPDISSGRISILGHDITAPID
jgi:hypothetical protein